MSQITDLREGSLEDAEEKAFRIEVETHKRRIRAQQVAAQELQAATTPPYRIFSEEDFDRQPVANWLVDELILEGSLNTFISPPAYGKTFAAIDLGLSVAAKFSTWLGRHLNVHGPVVYIAAEGQARFKLRKHAWKQVHGINRELPFYIVPMPIDLRNQTLIQRFADDMSELRPKLIVFDTLNRNTPGTDENAAKEMGEALAACGELKEKTGATLLLLHHPTKDGRTSRGSGALLGAVDAELWLERGAAKGLLRLEVGKQKEGDDDLRLDLKLKVVELADLSTGKPIVDPFSGKVMTSCVIELAQQADVDQARVSLPYLILEFVQKNPNIKKSELASKMGKGANPVRTALEALLAAHDLEETKAGRSMVLSMTPQGAQRIQQGPQVDIPF